MSSLGVVDQDRLGDGAPELFESLEYCVQIELVFRSGEWFPPHLPFSAPHYPAPAAPSSELNLGSRDIP